MIKIPKDKAAIYRLPKQEIYYCFDHEIVFNEEYDHCEYNDYEILEDVTVDYKNRLHSYNNKPALVIKGNAVKYHEFWFENGIKQNV